MAAEESTNDRMAWWDSMGFSLLFRAFRISRQPTKLALAFCGILAIYLVGRTLDGLWMSEHQPWVIEVAGDTSVSEFGLFEQNPSASAEEREQLLAPWANLDRKRVGVFSVLMERMGRTTNELAHGALLADPARVVQAIEGFVNTKLWLVRMHPLFAILFGMAWLVIWAFFGGAICRASALHAARDEQIGFREALAFARSRLRSFVFAPLLPIIITVVGGLVLFLGGLLGLIPAVGEILVGVLFFAALAIGAGLAVILIGAVGGSWLMFPTIAVEGSDAGDALARSVSYVYGRPWRTGLYCLVASVYGAVCFLVVKLFARVALILVHMFVSFSMNWGSAYIPDGEGNTRTGEQKLTVMWQSPDLSLTTPFWGGFDSGAVAGASRLGQWLIQAWVFSLVGVVAAFLVSFAYTASTLIYLLLRRDVDATDLDDVYLDDFDQETTSPPAPESEPAQADSGDTSLPVVEF